MVRNKNEKKDEKSIVTARCHQPSPDVSLLSFALALPSTLHDIIFMKISFANCMPTAIVIFRKEEKKKRINNAPIHYDGWKILDFLAMRARTKREKRNKNRAIISYWFGATSVERKNQNDINVIIHVFERMAQKAH